MKKIPLLLFSLVLVIGIGTLQINTHKKSDQSQNISFKNIESNEVINLAPSKNIFEKTVVFEDKETLGEYSVTAVFESCSLEESPQSGAYDYCVGPADLNIVNTKTNQAQTIHSDWVSYETGGAYPFIFTDYNFDGMIDFSTTRGKSGPYGAPQWSVYLFDAKTSDFVKAPAYEFLGEDYMFFGVDNEMNEIVAVGKSGAYIKYEDRYVLIHNELHLIKKIETELTVVENKGEKIYSQIISEFRNGKWSTTTKLFESIPGRDNVQGMQ